LQAWGNPISACTLASRSRQEKAGFAKDARQVALYAMVPLDSLTEPAIDDLVERKKVLEKWRYLLSV